MWFRKRDKDPGTCSPGVKQAQQEREFFQELAAEIDADAPIRAEMRAEAKRLKARGDASAGKNHFGETLEAAMRKKGLAL